MLELEQLEARLLTTVIPLGKGIVGPALAYEQPPSTDGVQGPVLTISGSVIKVGPRGTIWCLFSGTVTDFGFPGIDGDDVTFTNPGGGIPDIVGNSTRVNGNSPASYSLMINLLSGEQGIVQVNFTDPLGRTGTSTCYIQVM